MKYNDGSPIKTGDVFTDGIPNREDIRLKNRAKVLYVDKFTLVWFPLNDFTTHTDSYRSKTWCLSAIPKKIEMDELTDEELNVYNNVDSYING